MKAYPMSSYNYCLTKAFFIWLLTVSLGGIIVFTLNVEWFSESSASRTRTDFGLRVAIGALYYFASLLFTCFVPFLLGLIYWLEIKWKSWPSSITSLWILTSTLLAALLCWPLPDELGFIFEGSMHILAYSAAALISSAFVCAKSRLDEILEGKIFSANGRFINQEGRFLDEQ